MYRCSCVITHRPPCATQHVGLCIDFQYASPHFVKILSALGGTKSFLVNCFTFVIKKDLSSYSIIRSFKHFACFYMAAIDPVFGINDFFIFFLDFVYINKTIAGFDFHIIGDFNDCAW